MDSLFLDWELLRLIANLFNSSHKSWFSPTSEILEGERDLKNSSTFARGAKRVNWKLRRRFYIFSPPPPPLSPPPLPSCPDDGKWLSSSKQLGERGELWWVPGVREIPFGRGKMGEETGTMRRPDRVREEARCLDIISYPMNDAFEKKIHSKKEREREREKRIWISIPQNW